MIEKMCAFNYTNTCSLMLQKKGKPKIVLKYQNKTKTQKNLENWKTPEKHKKKQSSATYMCFMPSTSAVAHIFCFSFWKNQATMKKHKVKELSMRSMIPNSNHWSLHARSVTSLQGHPSISSLVENRALVLARSRQ